MDFLGDLLDLGDRKHRRGGHGGHHGHDDDYDGDRYDQRPASHGYDEHGAGPSAAPCVKCATTLLASFNFCPNCGTAVPRARKCGSCSAEVAPHAKFCPSCGAKAV